MFLEQSMIGIGWHEIGEPRQSNEVFLYPNRKCAEGPVLALNKLRGLKQAQEAFRQAGGRKRCAISFQDSQ
ncbi:MAG: hypothetical protein ABSB50_03190 [Terracidiphilus sp.]|jgi:hypothetical protein